MKTNRLIANALMGAALLFVGTCVNAQKKSKQNKPNIIYILADDLGYNDLGCYGQEKIKTPYLDKMAEEGMRFTQHYSGAALCAPSRYTLITGKHIGRSHTTGQRQELKKDEFTIHKLCKQNGYKTAAIGKWGLGLDPNDQGVDEWYGFLNQGYAHFYYPERIWENRKQIEIPENYEKEGLRVDGRYTDKIKNGVYIHDSFTDRALSFIKKNKKNPFFLYIPYTIPHLEVIVPEDSMAQYNFEEVPFDTKSKDLPDTSRGYAVGGTKFYDNQGYCSNDRPRAAYAGMVSRMDRDIGRIIKMLKKLKIDENTLIVFSSDNGPSSWSKGGCDREFFESSGALRAGKGAYYEGGIRVPMIARWPGKIAPNTISDHASYFPDIMPTIADIIDVELKTKIDGISMLPTLLQKGQQKEHEFQFWQNAVRKGKWKFVNGGKEYSGKRGVGQLFDLENDISESKDVTATYPEIAKEMKKIFSENKIKKKVSPKKNK